jgi:hypothetical protein
MRGLVINGFTVVEALGSGQGGILYLARDSAGREAVIRVARDGEDNLSIRIFTEEAQKLVPAATSVETSTTADGRRVLMALATPPAREPPGSGFTEHPVTQRLVPVSSLPPPTAPSRVPFAILLLALVVFGAGAAMVTLSMRGPPLPVMTVVQPSQPPPVPVALDAAVAPVAAVEPAPSEPAAPAPPAPKATTAESKPSGEVAGVRACTMSPQWRRAAEHDLLRHRQLAALMGIKAFDEFETAEDRLMGVVNGTKDGSDCRAVDAKIEGLTRSWQKRFAALCPPGGAWKNKVRLRVLDAEGLPASKQRELIDQIRAATDERECLTVLAEVAKVTASGP